jgi:uncharacterized protein YjeT (DUF2065 family)
MHTAIDLTAWSALLLGLFALMAGIGALRQPGIWMKMVEEISASPTLQLLSGMVEMALGALIYLANPWVPADLLSCVMKAAGGFMVFEALAVTGFCDIYLHAWLKNLGALDRRWAIVTILWGLALSVPAFMRFQ